MEVGRSTRAAIAAAVILTVYVSAATAACEAKSGNTRVSLLELYTSEGCDSCPPADRWLAELPKKGLSSSYIVPLAFHVDYWNYLGWVDPFAQKSFSDRQRDFGDWTKAATVYTPEFLLNGTEYRRWTIGNFTDEIKRAAQKPARADITLRLSRVGSTLQIASEASLRERRDASLYVALYENNLRTDVRAGENRGRTLQHEFVVRRLLGPFPLGDGKIQRQETLTLARDWKVADLGVATFVQETRGTEILQALALSLCP